MGCGRAITLAIQYPGERGDVSRGKEKNPRRQSDDLAEVWRSSPHCRSFQESDNDSGERCARTGEVKCPSLVAFVIVTDGHENSSREYHLQQVSEMITHQREKYGWQFTFLCARSAGYSAPAATGRARRRTGSGRPSSLPLPGIGHRTGRRGKRTRVLRPDMPAALPGRRRPVLLIDEAGELSSEDWAAAMAAAGHDPVAGRLALEDWRSPGGIGD